MKKRSGRSPKRRLESAAPGRYISLNGRTTGERHHRILDHGRGVVAATLIQAVEDGP